MSHHSTAKSVQHPYVRISHPEQRKGGGLERQTAADLEEFGRRFGFTTGKRVYVDDGVSAWQGLNATPNHELGRFLAEARRGIIRPGDCLLIENYDRLSRQDPWAAIGLVSELRSLGVHVGRLDRMKLLRYDSKDYGDFFEAAVEFMRGNSESEAKSMRNREAWKRKRKAAREHGETFTRQLPAWIEEKDGERRLRPESAVIMKRIFHLAANGYGHVLIVKRFTAEGVPHFLGEHWTRSYIARILRDRRALGEFQPRLRNGEKDGEAIQNYYPAAVTQEEWDAARAGANKRNIFRGRQAEHVNVFAGLLRNALGGDSYFAATWMGKNGERKRILKNNMAADGRGGWRTFPFATFERAVLSCLREIDPRTVLNGDSSEDELKALKAEWTRVENELAEAIAFMNQHRFSAAIGKRVSDLETRKEELDEQLAEARQKAQHPLSETWGECQTLLDALDRAENPNDIRLRIQSALRRMVDSIWMLVVPRGRDRLCAVQIWFHGGKRHRDYLILHCSPLGNRHKTLPGAAYRNSLASVARAGEIDLRHRKDVAKLEAFLSAVDLPTLTAAMQKLPDLEKPGAKS